MATAGPSFPASTGQDNSLGTVGWTSDGNIVANDGAYAYMSAAGTSYFLKATNFGFAIPSGATIDGVTVRYECGTTASMVNENSLKLIKANVISGDERSATVAYGGSDTVYERGSAADLWGLSLSAEDINDSTFGVGLSIYDFMGDGDTRVDYVTIEITYTAAIESEPQVVASASSIVARSRPVWSSRHRTYEHYPELVPETTDNQPSVIRSVPRIAPWIFARSRVIGAADDFQEDSTPGWDSSVVLSRGRGLARPVMRSRVVLLDAPEGQGSVCCCPFGAVVVSRGFATVSLVSVEPKANAANTAAVISDKFATAVLVVNTCTC